MLTVTNICWQFIFFPIVLYWRDNLVKQYRNHLGQVGVLPFLDLITFCCCIFISPRSEVRFPLCKNGFIYVTFRTTRFRLFLICRVGVLMAYI